MDDIAQTFTIGAFAAAAGVNVETIRYYQRKGLLPEPAAGARHPGSWSVGGCESFVERWQCSSLVLFQGPRRAAAGTDRSGFCYRNRSR